MQHSSTDSKPGDVAPGLQQQPQDDLPLRDQTWYTPTGVVEDLYSPAWEADASRSTPVTREEGRAPRAPPGASAAPSAKPSKARARRERRNRLKPVTPHSVDRAQTRAIDQLQGVQVVQQVAAPSPPRQTTVAANAAKWHARAILGSPAFKTLVHLGVPTRPLEDEGHEPGHHPASAQVRKACLIRAYAMLYAGGARKIMALDGAARDRATVDYLNTNVPLNDQIVLTIYQNPQDAKQASRQLEEATRDLGGQGAYDAYVATDSYSFQGHPWTPKRLFGVIGSKPLCWIGQSFHGAMSTVCGEGGWVRIWHEGQESILHKSDEFEQSREPHDPLDWLQTNATVVVSDFDALSWHEDRAIGPMTVIYVTRVDVPDRLPTPVQQDAQFVWEDLPVPDAESRLSSWMVTAAKWCPGLHRVMPKQRSLVDLRLQKRLITQKGWKSFSPYSFRSLANTAANYIQENEDYRLLDKLFPSIVMSVGEATVLSAFLKGVKRARYEAEAMYEIHGNDMERFNLAVSKIGMKRESSWVWPAVAGVGVLTTLFVLRRFTDARRAKALTAAPGLDFHRTWQACQVTAVTLWCEATEDWARLSAPLIQRTATFSCVAPLRETWSLIRTLPERISRGLDIVSPEVPLSYMGMLGMVVAEETGKDLLPQGHFWFPIAEAVNKLIGAPAWDAPTLTGVGLAMAMHWSISRLSWSKRVLCHGLYNTCVFAVVGSYGVGQTAPGMYRVSHTSPAFEHRIWREHRLNYFELPWALRGHWDSTMVGVHAFPPSSAVIRRESVPHFAAKTLDTSMRVTPGFLPEDPEETSATSVHYFLPTCIPVYAPGRTDMNLNGVIKGRLLVAPPLEPLPQAIRWAGYALLHEGLISMQYPALAWEELKLAWLAHISEAPKKKRAIAALTYLEEYGLDWADKATLENAVFVKTDEVLCKKGKEGVELKPRPVVNVDPVVQARAGPELLKASELLHDEWAWTWGSREPLKVTVGDSTLSIKVTFGSNATDVLLTEWLEEALEWHPERGAWVLMAGDDSLVLCYQHGVMVCIFEGDFSMYDQSQSIGPLRAEMTVLSRLGVTPQVTDLLMRSARAKIKARGRRGDVVVIHHPTRPMRVTGGADTTIGNTINGVCCWVMVLSQLDWQRPMREQGHSVCAGMEYFGFELKLRIAEDPTEVSFLKGSWVVCANRRVWAPSPSRILKVGKSLRNPRELYPGLSYTEAASQFLNDVAASYRNFAQVPGVGGFVARFYTRPQRRDYMANEPWKVASAFPESPGRPEDLSGMAARFGVDERELWELDDLVRQADPFTMLVHPVLEALAQVDYN